MQKDTRFLQSPDVQIDWCGFVASAWHLQRAGWRFEELLGPGYDRHEKKTIVARHPSGMSGVGSCDERDLMQAISLNLQMRSDCRPVFRIERMVGNPRQHTIQGFSPMSDYKVRALDMEPGILEFSSRQMHRFTLADLFPERPPEEIIVEPATVMGLLEQIKQLQAPELAEIRARNRRRDACDRAPEIRHATILSIAA